MTIDSAYLGVRPWECGGKLGSSVYCEKQPQDNMMGSLKKGCIHGAGGLHRRGDW